MDLYDFIFPVTKFEATTVPDENDYGDVYLTVGSESVLVFTVMVCQDAIVTLQEYPGINHYNSYEVIFGLNNERTEVLNTAGGNTLAYANTKDILSCSSPRQFWISWEDKLLEIGSGPSPGVSRFLQWDMTSTYYSIRAAAFSTIGTHKGLWEFKSTTGTYYTNIPLQVAELPLCKVVVYAPSNSKRTISLLFQLSYNDNHYIY